MAWRRLDATVNKSNLFILRDKEWKRDKKSGCVDASRVMNWNAVAWYVHCVDFWKDMAHSSGSDNPNTR